MEPKDAARIFPAYREKLKSESNRITREEQRQNNIRWLDSETMFGYNVLRLALPLLEQHLSDQMIPVEKRTGWNAKKIVVVGAWAIHSTTSWYAPKYGIDYYPLLTYAITTDADVGWIQESTSPGVYEPALSFGTLKPNNIYLSRMGRDESNPSHFNGHTIYHKLQDLLATVGIEFSV